MKKHLLGFLILLLTFGIGFLSAPIRFSSFGFGQTSRGWFTAYSSTYFVKLSLSGENYETPEETDDTFKSRVKLFSEDFESQEVLEREENRAIISFQSDNFGRGFCIIRKNEDRLYNVCSTSLRHVLEFEKQRFPEN